MNRVVKVARFFSWSARGVRLSKSDPLGLEKIVMNIKK